jgi:putative hydrolase of HD superfamily
MARFLRLAGGLKWTHRTGWVDRGIPAERAESVADHSFRVALLAWCAAAGVPDLDRERVLVLALLHDLAEAVTGDLTPYDLATRPDESDDDRRTFLDQRHIPEASRAAAKRAAEAAALTEMTRDLPAPLRREIEALWRELAERSTPEARFVKQIDKLETYLQSLEYAAESPGLPVGSFAAEVAEVVDTPSLAVLRDAIRVAFTAAPSAPDAEPERPNVTAPN